MKSSYSEKPFWLQTDSPQISQFDLLIGWDSEFYPDQEKQERMKIISYQFVAYQQKKNRYFEKIIYTDQRKTLQEMLKEIIEDLAISRGDIEKKELDNDYFKILLVAHYSKAEGSMLKNRHLLVKHLTGIDGTLTSPSFLRLTIPYRGRNQKISVFGKDIYLLTQKKGRSLRNISESCGNKKIEISPQEKERMDLFQKEKEEEFAQYAISDARIALEYYCKIIDNYYKLSQVEDTPLTLGDAAVKGYIKHLEKKSISEKKETNRKLNKKGYEEKVLGIEGTAKRKRQKIKNRGVDEGFANNTYLGGINTSYRVGKFFSANHGILDIDIASCYPTSLAVQPIIDGSKHSKKYVLYDILKEKARLSQKTVDIGLFLISNFKFPAEIYQTAFPIPNDGGLIYTLEGKDVYTTYPEVVTAISQQVALRDQSLEEVRIFEELKDDNDQPILAFASFLQFLVSERENYKEKDSFKANIFKQMYLSFYGKLGQGITERYTYNLRGEKKKMKESKISVPHYASICTSLVRCAMIELVNYFESVKVKVLNATTDGMMIAVPKEYFPVDFKPQVDQFSIVDCRNISFEKIFPNFYKDLSQKYAISRLIEGRKNLNQNQNGIEVKHLGDLAHTGKTRVNCLVYEGTTQSIARESAMGKEIRTYEDILSYDREEPTEVENNELSSVEDILRYNCDLVQRKKIAAARYNGFRKINLDYDYKRDLIGNETRQFESIEEWERKRLKAAEVRRLKRRSTEDLLVIKEKGIRIRGSFAQIVTRIFLRELFKIEKNLRSEEVISKLAAGKKKNYPLQEWEINENLLKKCKIKAKNSSSFVPKLPQTAKVRNQINSMAEALAINSRKIFTSLGFRVEGDLSK